MMAGGVGATATQCLIGWSTGFSYTLNKSTEDEIRQGGNPILASMAQAGQAGAVSMVVDKLADFIPEPITRNTIKVFSNIVPILSFPSAIFCGIVRDRGNYPKFAAFVNRSIVDRYLRSGCRLPEHVEDMSPWTVDVIDYLADHGGDLMQAAMVVGSVALIVLGSYVLGVCILGALVYQVLDEDLGIIPRKISLFMETYMPIVSWVGILIAGNPVLQVMAAYALVSDIPGVFPFLMEKMDAYVHKGLRKLGIELPGASLKEIHAPLITNRALTHEQITATLDGEEHDFELNPAHFAKPVFDMASLPQDRNFDKLLIFFDRVNWTQHYSVLRRKLRDDDRFTDFLVQQFPHVAKEELKEHFDDYVDRLAATEQITSAQFVANWIRAQMVGLVTVLKGERRVKGRQQDLADAIESCAMLIPYLERLGQDEHIDFEDTILALAVEGGFYCARGVKRIASELVRKLLYHTLPQHAERAGNPDRDYELRIRQGLQDRRAEIVEAKYRWLVNDMLQVPDVIAKDVHGHDIYRLFLSEGFTPLTEYERDQMDTTAYLVWEIYHHMGVYQPAMMSEYRDGSTREQIGTWAAAPKPADQRGLDETIHDQGEVNFGDYIRRVINANPNLTEEQKEALIERYVNIGFSEDTAQEMHRFHRLMLVMLGVLRPVQDKATASTPTIRKRDIRHIA